MRRSYPQYCQYYTSLFPLFPFRCGCDECVISRLDDSLRHSRSRINAYRALASPSLISLSSKDPILTAFELSWELRRLSFLEHEFKVRQLCIGYNEYEVSSMLSIGKDRTRTHILLISISLSTKTMANFL